MNAARGPAANLLQRFFAANARLCKQHFQPRLYTISHMSAVDWWFQQRVRTTSPRETLLELGCGRHFPLSRELGPYFAATSATDLEDVPRSEWPAGVCFRRCTETTLPFGDAAFDVVAIRSVIEHVRHPETFFAEVSRVLRPGGAAFISLPNKFDYVSLGAKWAGPLKSAALRYFVAPSWDDFPVFYRANTRGSLRRAIERTSLDVESFRPLPSEPYYLRFFVPLYLAGSIYQFVISLLSLDFLQPSFLVVLRKRDRPNPDGKDQVDTQAGSPAAMNRAGPQ